MAQKKLMGSAEPSLAQKCCRNFSNIIAQWSREWMWFIIHGLAVGGAINWIQTVSNYFLSKASRFWTFHNADNAHQTFNLSMFAIPGISSLSGALNLWICLNQSLCRFGFWVASKIIFCNSSKRGEWRFCVDITWGLTRVSRCAPRQPFINTWAAFHCGSQNYSNIWNSHRIRSPLASTFLILSKRWAMARCEPIIKIHLVRPFVRI